MAERRKYIIVALEVYEVLLIKAETPVNNLKTNSGKSQHCLGLC